MNIIVSAVRAALSLRPVSDRSLLQLLWCFAAAGPVVAQAAAAPGSQGADLVMIEEVVVTAQKREEPLQKVPVAITALDSQAMAARNVTNVQDIAGFAPNLQIARAGAASGGPIFIRGVGQSDALSSADPGVGIYIDGVYLGRGATGSLFDLLDIERIEVLRGPQGTLYGKSTIGGALNVISKRPSEDFSASLKAALGSSEQQMFVGNLNAPLSSKLLLRASALRETRDGYTEDLNSGRQVDDRDVVAGRFQLRYLASDSLDMQLSADMNRRRDGQSAIRRVTAGTTIAEGNPDPFKGSYNYVGFADGDYSGVTAHVNWSSPALSIVSISAYRDIDEAAQQDIDGGPTAVLLQGSAFKQHEMSQEVQFLGSAFDERLRWIAGIYGFREKAHYVELTNLFSTALPVPGASTLSLLLEPENTTYAAFSQVDWRLTEKLTATGGVRYSHENREIFVRQGAFTGEKEKDWSKVTSRLSLAYQATDTLLIYATAAEGFKAGQFNSRATTAAAFQALEPEEVLSYELGLKSRFADSRVQLNAAAFYSDYENIQIQTFVASPSGVGFVSSNAPKGEVQGLEVELALQPARALRLQATVGLLDAKFTEFSNLAGQDLSGRKFAFAPETTYSFAGQYTQALGAVGSMTMAASYSHKSKIFQDVTNIAQLAQDDVGLLNAKLTYASPSDRYEVSLYGKNLTDEEYLSHGLNIAGLLGGPAAGFFGAPRTYGIEAQVRFD